MPRSNHRPHARRTVGNFGAVQPSATVPGLTWVHPARRRDRVEVQALPATGTRRLFGRPTFTDRLARRLNEDHGGRLSVTGEALPTLTIGTEEGQREIRRMLITVTIKGFVVGSCLLAWRLRYQP
jgi:hypothetical protein